MSSAAIRAGAAFVELLIKDETVQASLDNVKTKLRSFGAAVDSVSSGSFAALQAAGTTSVVSTGASVGVLAATMGVLKAGVYAVGNAFRVTFNMITGSVTRAVVGLGLVGLAVARFAPKGGKLAGFLDSFLKKSQTTEAIGRWTRFAGALTGSSVIKGLGNQIERLGLGSAIVRGFRGGLFSGLGATLGAGLRSAKSVVASGVIGLFSGPIGVVRGMLGSVAGGLGGGGGGGGGLKSIATSSGGVAAGLAKATGAATTFGATTSIFGRVSSSVQGLLLKVGGLAAAITGPALLAAKNFVSSAEDIIKASKKTGDEFVSINDGINKTFGKNALVSHADIIAADALGTAMSDLKKTAKAAWAQIGIAAMPVLKALTENMQWAAGAIEQVLGRNRELLVTVIGVAAKIGSAAAAGYAMFKVFSVGAAVLPMLLPFLPLLIKIGVVLGALAAVAYLFPAVGRAILDAFAPVAAFLKGKFADLSATVQTTIGGIKDALSAGDLTAAARVLWAGINVVWLSGTDELRRIWRSAVTTLRGVWIEFSSYIQGTWTVAMSFVTTALEGVQTAWNGYVDLLQTAWGAACDYVQTAWQAVADYFSSAGTFISETWTAVTDAISAAWQQTTEYLGSQLDAFASAIPGLKETWTAVMTYFSEAWNGVVNGFVSTWRTAQNAVAGGIARVIASMTGQLVDDVLATLNEMQNAEAKIGNGGVTAEMSERAKAAQKRLDEIEEQRKARLGILSEEAKAAEKNADDKLAAARKELTESAKAAAALKPLTRSGGADAAKEALGASSSLGTFSTGALGRQSIGGLSLLQKSSEATAKNTEQTVKVLEKLEFKYV